MPTLLKWSSGAKPGLKRINKPSPTPLSERKKKYEDHRKQRSFQNSWTIGRSWLKDTPNGMICLICQVRTIFFIPRLSSYGIFAIFFTIKVYQMMLQTC